MILSKKREWFEGERIVRIEPEKQRRIEDTYLQRPYLYTGRPLTDTSLIRSTKHRLRHLILFGRQLSAGVIRGLELSPFQKPFISEGSVIETKQWLRIGEGLGLTVYGDDISLSRTTDILLDNVTLHGSDAPARGVGIFVLEPIEIFDEVLTDNESQCPWDKERDALEDEQIIDSCRLVFYPWPTELGIIPPVTGPQLRNQLAYLIFDHEQSNPLSGMPWDETGIALGLAYISEEGHVSFIDRYAVVRQGGAPMSVRPILMTNGTPILWNARIQQLVEHLYDIKELKPDIPSSNDYFEVLPPAGLLPKQIMDFTTMSTGFFPSQFIVNAVPVPEEQLEVTLNASAGLTPFDLHMPEKIKLLVPVPQAVYEPDLLKKEIPDPIFLETLRKLIHQIRIEKADRLYLRNQASHVIGAINILDVPVFDASDPDAIPDEQKFPAVVPHEEGITDYGNSADIIISKLRNWLEDNTTIYWKDYQEIAPDNVGTDAFDGLEDYIQSLINDIDTSEEYVSAKYVKTEAEIYRLRQLMLGNIKASRLATSPAMGMIVEGQTRTPTVDDVEKYFTNLAAEAVNNTDNVVSNNDDLNTDSITLRGSADNKAISMLAQPNIVTGAASPNNLLYNTLPLYVKTNYIVPANTFKWKGILRDKKIIERVYESPAMEIKRKAVATKADIFEALRKIPLQIIDEVTIAPTDTAVFFGSSYETFRDKFDPVIRTEIIEKRARKPVNFEVNSDQFIALIITPLTEEEKTTLTENDITQAQINSLNAALKNEAGHNKVSLKKAVLSKNIREGLFDPDPTDDDEAGYFSAGVSALEHALEAMRVVDQKLSQYRLAVTQCQTALNKLAINSKKWKDAISEIEDKLAVLRHDALVTRSLFEEEKSRIDNINARRMKILDEYVNVLAYVRPRLVEARCDTPSVKLYGVYESPVAACLEEDYEATDDLEDMLDTFREIPVSWLSRAMPLLLSITSVTHFISIYKQASLRSKNIASIRLPASDFATRVYSSRQFSMAAKKVVYTHQQTKKQASLVKANIDIQKISILPWQAIKKKAENELSLADLISSGKGKSAIASRAAAILEDMEDIAVCLYNRCCELKPAIRLQWANKISIFDDPIKLQHLDTLPAWDKVEAVMRRDLQNLVDWLFQQIDINIPKAEELMNDLVRVCILLASHAPVSSLISGHLSAPAQGRSGDMVDMVVDKGDIKIGMLATVFNNNKVAVQGKVEDISHGSARIKVTNISGAANIFSLEQGAQVKFYKSITQSKQVFFS